MKFEIEDNIKDLYDVFSQFIFPKYYYPMILTTEDSGEGIT